MTVAPTAESPLRVRLPCPDADDFAARFAPNVTRGGLFIPTRETRDVGAAIRFELALQDGTVVFAGVGVVTWAKAKGLGVKFTTLDPDSAPMLERLLGQRQAAPPAPPDSPAVPAPAAAAPAKSAPAIAAPASPAPAAAAPASPAPAKPALAKPAPAKPAAPPRVSPVAAWNRPTPPLGAPLPVEAPTTGPSSTSASTSTSWAPSPRPPRRSFALAATLICVAVVAIVSVSVGRARLGTRSSSEPAKPAAVAIAPAPAVAIAAPPPETAPAPAEAEAAPSAPPAVAARPASAIAERPGGAPASARPGGLHVESMLVGPFYRRFTCPNPTNRLSVRSSRTVNVCLQVAHRPGKAERLTLIWERDGALAGKTHVQLPASRPNVRTRAHMRISDNRLGAWSVRVVSERDAPLAQATFDVVR